MLNQGWWAKSHWSMRGRIGIAHLSNFELRVASYFWSYPLPLVKFSRKIRSVIQPSVGRTSARSSAGRDSESEFRRIRSYPSLHISTRTPTVSVLKTLPHFSLHLRTKSETEISALSSSIIRIRCSTSSISMFWWCYHSTFLHTTSLFNPFASCEGRNAQTNLEAASSAS